MQGIFNIDTDLEKINDLFVDLRIKKPMLVRSHSAERTEFYKCLKSMEKAGVFDLVEFLDFVPNPTVENVENGSTVFSNSHCDAIIAIGGGSAIDVSKCIRMKQGDIPYIVTPTTAGSGAEATKFAVIYENGVKKSVEDAICLPRYVVFEPNVLRTLPDYLKRVSLMDAICHSLESFLSVSSTEESKMYASEALQLVIENQNDYLMNFESSFAAIQKAAYLAGKAINITHTTAAHALAYKLTTMYKLPHGHAVGICMKALLPLMVNNIDNCCDKRGKVYFENALKELAAILCLDSVESLVPWFDGLIEKMELHSPNISKEDIDLLASSVNQERLRNNAICIDDNIREIYESIAEFC